MNCLNHNYTPEQFDFLREHCRLPRKEMTERFNARFKTNLNRDQLAQICLRRGWLTGRNGCFKQGVQVWNKGLKGFVAPGAEKGWFKKGALPPKAKPIYSQRYTKEGYLEIKTDNVKKWELKHRMVWREHFGAIPKSHVVCFKDGDIKNITIENLELMPRALHVVLAKRGYYSEPIELRPSIRAQIELQMKINKIERSQWQSITHTQKSSSPF